MLYSGDEAAVTSVTLLHFVVRDTWCALSFCLGNVVAVTSAVWHYMTALMHRPIPVIQVTVTCTVLCAMMPGNSNLEFLFVTLR